MVAFIFSLLVTFAMMGVVVLVGKKRSPDKPLTWGEAFIAASFVFLLLMLAYGIVPNQWLLWADNELGWRKDAFFFGDNGLSIGGRGRVMITKEAVRDVIAATIYIVFLGVQGFMWTWWQRRGKIAEERQKKQLISAYGRPLVRKA